MQTPPRFGGKVGKRSSRPTRFTILPIWVLPRDIQELRGRDLTGTARDLYQGSDGQSLDGDLIELGYYKLSDNSANTSNTNLFKGTWTPLTTKTTIGHNYYFDSSNNAGSTAGQFHFSTKFSSGTGNDTTTIRQYQQ